jgi:hypothetical protein
MPGPRRTSALLAALIALVLGVVLVNLTIDRTTARSNAAYELDRFGNPWFPNYEQTNDRISSLEHLRTWLLWAGVLPMDALLLASAVLDIKRRRARWLGSIALATGLVVAGLLALAALASVLPGPAMIG